MSEEFEIKDLKAEDKAEGKAAAKKVVAKKAAAKVNTDPNTIVAGEMVKPVYGLVVDAETCAEYPPNAWTEVKQPSDFLNGQLAAGKVEKR